MTRHGWAGKGGTRAWARTRLSVLVRDKWKCRLNLDGCTGDATCVHHVLGKGAGDDPASLLSACEPCNLKVGDPLKHNPPMRSATRW